MQQNLPQDAMYLAAKKNAGCVHRVMTAGMLVFGSHFNL